MTPVCQFGSKIGKQNKRQMYRGHRHPLTLKSPTNRLQTSDETAMELIKLVNEGAKFLISDNVEGGI